MLSTIKHCLANRLPPGLLQAAKRIYYPRLLKSFDASQWPGSAVVRHLVGPGDGVLDAGANIGYVTLLLSRWVGGTGFVCAIEPVPETHALLAHNLRRLGCANVRLFACAVSSSTGSAEMVIPRYAAGGENLYEARIPARDAAMERDQRRMAVPLRTLDEIAGGDLPRITFVKLDVEGHELEALRGATRLLEHGHAAFFIEVQGDPDAPGAPAGDVLALMAQQDYAPHVIHGDRAALREPGEHAVDYLFLADGHRRRLIERGLITDYMNG